MTKFNEINEMVNTYMQNAIFLAFTMEQLITDLMDLAKLERATFQLNNEYFNLIDVVTEVF